MPRGFVVLIAAAMIAGCGEKAVERAGDPAKGRALFVERGCVLCHAANGVGGEAAPAFAADAEQKADPLDFAARIWRGAPAMVEFQSLELGYVIDLSADDIAHLAAFAASAAEQGKLDPSAIPAELRDAFVDERYWEVDDWSEFMDQRGEAPEIEPLQQ